MGRQRKTTAELVNSKAAELTRKDSVISFTLPHMCRVLCDMLADARGIQRSEYLRQLILQDAQQNSPALVAEALAHGTNVLIGRPSVVSKPESEFAVQQEGLRLALCKKYPWFMNSDAWTSLFEERDGVRHFVFKDKSFTEQEFGQLNIETVVEMMQEKHLSVLNPPAGFIVQNAEVQNADAQDSEENN
jgi:hypothetical protein